MKEVVYPTDERVSFTDLKQFKGNILECINEGMKYIQNNIHYSAEIEGTKRIETPEIPIKAIREIVINSLAHCKYQKGDCNEITITKSKVRIYNPGGILNDVNPVDFANGKIGSKIRNPLIATALFKNGLIDAFGTGFDRTFRVCAEAKVEYEFQNDEYGFTFVFKRKNLKIANQNDKLNDKISDKINDKINLLDKKILKLLSDNAYMTIPEIARSVSKSEPTVHRHLNSLTSQNKIQRIGSRKSGYWKVK